MTSISSFRVNREIVEIENKLKLNDGIIDENKKFAGSKKYGKNGILYENVYCRKIMKTYDGIHTPKIEKTVKNLSRNFPRLSAATIPIKSPATVPNKIAITPILKEFSKHFNKIGFIGAPL